jgi:hypothetical protein
MQNPADSKTPLTCEAGIHISFDRAGYQTFAIKTSQESVQERFKSSTPFYFLNPVGPFINGVWLWRSLGWFSGIRAFHISVFKAFVYRTLIFRSSADAPSKVLGKKKIY